MTDLSESGIHRIIRARTGRWYLHWSTAFAGLVLCMCGCLFTGWPLIGRVAWADETDRRIDSKISTAIKPLIEAQTALSTAQTEQRSILFRLATASLRADICRYAGRRIIERDANERSRLLDQINDMRTQYKLYSGREFDPADC